MNRSHRPEEISTTSVSRPIQSTIGRLWCDTYAKFAALYQLIEVAEYHDRRTSKHKLRNVVHRRDRMVVDLAAKQFVHKVREEVAGWPGVLDILQHLCSRHTNKIYTSTHTHTHTHTHTMFISHHQRKVQCRTSVLTYRTGI
jgi:hypothetical protein